VEQAKVQTPHVQADEIRAKGRKLVAWMGLALDATSRLWLAGVVSIHRDRDLADRLLQQVPACCQGVRALLVGTEGWNVYPKSMLRLFRDKVKKKAGPGRACLEVWPQLCMATVIKHTKKKRVVEVSRKITWGALEKAHHLLTMTPGCKAFNTSLMERFNATMRQRLASLTRTCRHAAQRLEPLETGMYVIGSTYNFCWPHQALRNRKHFGSPCPPALAARLPDHLGSVSEVLPFKVAPAPWGQPKRRGRAPNASVADPTMPQRPRGRPRKHPLPDPCVPKRPRGRPRQVA
jgi:hypothetical protein